MASRTLVVGDVHGCRAELEALLSLADFHIDKDELVLVGDLCGKGPDTAGAIRIARSCRARCVRGNHDARWLRKRSSHPELNEADWGFLEDTPLYLRLSVRPRYGGALRDVLVVHAGLEDGVALEAQDPLLMMNARTYQPDGTLSSAFVGDPWAARWSGPELVVFGHDARRGRQEYAHALGLDTGCCYGGRLTALRLVDGEAPEWLFVDAAAAYAPVS